MAPYKEPSEFETGLFTGAATDDNLLTPDTNQPFATNKPDKKRKAAADMALLITKKPET